MTINKDSTQMPADLFASNLNSLWDVPAADENAKSQRAESGRRSAIDIHLGPHVAPGDNLGAHAEGERRVERDLDQEVIEDNNETVSDTDSGRKDRDENGPREENRLRIEQVNEEALAESVSRRYQPRVDRGGCVSPHLVRDVQEIGPSRYLRG